MISIVLKLLFWVLIIVLFVVLLLLFYPVLYRGQITANELSSEGIHSLVRIRLVSVLVILVLKKQEEEMEIYLRILGIKIRLNEKDKREKKAVQSDNLKTDIPIKEEKSKFDGKMNISKSENNVKPKKKEKMKENETVFFRFLKKAKEKIQSLIRFFKTMKEKKENYVKLYETKSFKRAFNQLKSVFPKLVKHIVPRKVKGNIRIGFEECDSTGKFFGYYSVICSYFTYDVKVVPDFENKIFEGKMDFKGRIFPIYLIYYSLKLFLNNDVKLTYKRFKRMNGR